MPSQVSGFLPEIAAPHLLLVEDDPAISELLQFVFRSAGYIVRPTPDGEEALQIARAAAPDIVILDWRIEGITGIEVCRRLRCHESTAEVPIIMLSARSQNIDRNLAIQSGADDYLTKPFSPRELLARVRAILEISHIPSR